MSKFSNAKIHFDPLTDRQKEVLTGSLLGDAQLCLGKRCLHPYVKIERKLSDLKYLEWQYKCFENFCKSGIKEGFTFDNRTNKTYHHGRFITRAVPEFLPIYQKWYRNKIKMVPRDIVLSPLSVAVWFADDGTISHNGKSQLNAGFATDGFAHDDVLFLADQLKIVLNESFRVVFHAFSKKGEPQFTIDGSSAAIYALIKYMEPEFSKLSMDRKNVWSNISLDIPAQSKRSSRYYELADLILQSTTVSVKDIFTWNIYSAKTAISDMLYNFYKLGYFTRFRHHEGEGYQYTLTDIGKQYFLALQFEKQFEKQFINKE